MRGKKRQFPLHVWLPDAMEGPTPVSALIHAATMVAAGVYLVGRCYPIFTPEVLLVIAIVGTITLFMAATIAITATDIKRVLAYSTVSQLGYMMMALGLGGWLAGMFHLFTHAFFKSLLFLCSGSVIHATGTNEMPAMGGLRKKMPWTAGTMLVGCLAIAGAGIPLVVGLSGYYSKDGILAQALSFKQSNPMYGYFFWIATAGAAITAFYMFRLWYMTFAGEPRDEHVYHHAHESPWVMVGPLVVLAFFAVVAGWTLHGQLRPAAALGAGPAAGHGTRGLGRLGVADRHASRRSTRRTKPSIHIPTTLWAFGSGIGRFPAGDRVLRAEEAQPRRRQPAVCRHLSIPHTQVVVRRTLRPALRPSRAADLQLGRRLGQAGHRPRGRRPGVAGRHRGPAGRMDRSHFRRWPGERPGPRDLRRRPSAPRACRAATCGNT